MEQNTVHLCLVILAAISTVYMQNCTVEMFEGRYFCVYDQPHNNHEDAMFSCSNNFARLPLWDDIRRFVYIQRFLMRKLERSHNKIAWLSDSRKRYQLCAVVQGTVYLGTQAYLRFRDSSCTPLDIKPHTFCVCYDDCTGPISELEGPVKETFHPGSDPVPSDMPDFIPQTRAPIIMNRADFDMFDEDTTAISELTSTSDRDIAPQSGFQMEGDKELHIGPIAGGVIGAIILVIAISVIIWMIYKRKQKMEHGNSIYLEPDIPPQDFLVKPSPYEHLSTDDAQPARNDAKYEAINVAFNPETDVVNETSVSVSEVPHDYMRMNGHKKNQTDNNPGIVVVNETSVTVSEVPHDYMRMDGQKKNQTDNESKIGISNYQNVLKTGDYQNKPADVNPPPVYANI